MTTSVTILIPSSAMKGQPVPHAIVGDQLLEWWNKKTIRMTWAKRTAEVTYFTDNKVSADFVVAFDMELPRELLPALARFCERLAETYRQDTIIAMFDGGVHFIEPAGVYEEVS